MSILYPTSLKRKLPYITVSAKGLSNGQSSIPNDGADFGPDTLLNATAPNQYGPPYTQTAGIQEALNYASAINNDVYISPGTYKTYTTIILPANVSVHGAIKWLDYQNSYTYILYEGPSGNDVIDTPSNQFYEGVIDGLVIDGNGLAKTALNITAMTSTHIEHLLLQNAQNGLIVGCMIGSYIANITARFTTNIAVSLGDSAPWGQRSSNNNGIYDVNIQSFSGWGLVIGQYFNFSSLYNIHMDDDAEPSTAGVVSKYPYIPSTADSHTPTIYGLYIHTTNSNVYQIYMMPAWSTATPGLRVIGANFSGEAASVIYNANSANGSTYLQLRAPKFSFESSTPLVTGGWGMMLDMTDFTTYDARNLTVSTSYINSTGSILSRDLASAMSWGTPPVPASGTAYTNLFPFPVEIYIIGGALTEIQITIQGNTYTVYSNSTASPVYEAITLPNWASITLTYTTAPTWVWVPA